LTFSGRPGEYGLNDAFIAADVRRAELAPRQERKKNARKVVRVVESLRGAVVPKGAKTAQKAGNRWMNQPQKKIKK
jgi:hypothetical protein